jgi:uncharacterized protein YpuA (DUF1002 family)
MSQVTTLILLPQTAYQNPGNGAPYTVTGNAQPAAAYYLGNQDLQTVNFNITNMSGNIIIEATLASDSDNADWFKVYEFEAVSSNTSTFTNIDGNFVYLRAKIEDFNQGVVNFVKVSY